MGSFQIQRSGTGQFYWRFVANNGRTLCHSETYHNKQDAIASARIVRGSDGNTPIQDLT